MIMILTLRHPSIVNAGCQKTYWKDIITINWDAYNHLGCYGIYKVPKKLKYLTC
jgi:hypothetical protein